MAAEWIRFVALGLTGVGKSSLLNAGIGRKAFLESEGIESETATTQSALGKWRKTDTSVEVIDTPGLADTGGNDEKNMRGMVNFLKQSSKGVHCFLLCFNGASQTRLDKNMQDLLTILQELLSEKFWENVVLVYTHCDESARSVWETKVAGGCQLGEELRKRFGLSVTPPMVALSSKDTSAASDAPFLQILEHARTLKPFDGGQLPVVREAIQSALASGMSEQAIWNPNADLHMDPLNETLLRLVETAFKTVLPILVGTLVPMLTTACVLM